MFRSAITGFSKYTTRKSGLSVQLRLRSGYCTTLLSISPDRCLSGFKYTTVTPAEKGPPRMAVVQHNSDVFCLAKNSMLSSVQGGTLLNSCVTACVIFYQTISLFPQTGYEKNILILFRTVNWLYCWQLSLKTKLCSTYLIDCWRLIA